MSDLRRIRMLDKGISQFEFSKLSGVHPSRLSLLERGLTMPSTSEMKRISEALDMIPEEIFGPDVVTKRLTAKRRKGSE